MTDKVFEVCPLASGSRGNSLFVGYEDAGILVDAGLSGIEIQRRLEAVGVQPRRIRAILITHEHTDHVKGAGVLSRRFKIPVHISGRTHAACRGLGKIEQLSYFDCGTEFEVGPVRVTPFSISHDATDPAGFTVEHRGRKIGLATDLGIATNLVKQHLMDCHLLYLEANHDPEMLTNGPYPWHLKQRIRSRTGHLSNVEASKLVSELRNQYLEHVILAHLSEENNLPEKAAFEVGRRLNGSGIGLSVAGPDKPGRMIRV